jgi:arylsulfatase A-like enzyme
VEKVDREIGRILDALRDAGLQDDTLVVFGSDHGDGMATHHWNQKSMLYDEVAKVPFIIRYPGRVPSGTVDEAHLVSFSLDLLPTVCDYAGITPPDDLEGLSLRDLAEGRTSEKWRDQLVAEVLFSPEQRTHARMVRTQHFKYAVYSWGRYREQLFDMQTDPGEMVNLAVQARYADVLADHRGRLLDWCLRSGDLFAEHYGRPGHPSVPGHAWDA